MVLKIAANPQSSILNPQSSILNSVPSSGSPPKPRHLERLMIGNWGLGIDDWMAGDAISGIEPASGDENRG
jgi:hypothetical protein